MPDEYEIVPRGALKDIQKQLEEVKQKAEQGLPRNITDSMDNLANTINELMTLFKEASEEMKLEEKTAEEISKELTPIMNKLNKIEDQNKKIADGMLAIADMVEEIKKMIEAEIRKSEKITGVRHVPPLTPSQPSQPSSQPQLTRETPSSVSLKMPSERHTLIAPKEKEEKKKSFLGLFK